MTYSKVIYSATGSGAQTADIRLGKGDWEITALAVIMGSTIPSMNGMEIGEGTVAFEILEGDQTTVEQKQFLLSGVCTRTWPLVMDSSKRVKGPGRIRSKMVHDQSTEHTLTATYRRVQD